MNAYKCDRCGMFFERKRVPDITIKHFHFGNSETGYDLCPNCQEQLEKWLKSEVETKCQL